MTIVDIGLCFAVLILLIALVTVKRRRGVRENLLRHNMRIKERLIVGCHQQVDGLLTEIVQLKGYTATDRVMIEQLLKQNERLRTLATALNRDMKKVLQYGDLINPTYSRCIVTDVQGGGCTMSLLPESKRALSALFKLIEEVKCDDYGTK